VHSCYVLRVRPTWSSFLSLSIHTHSYTRVLYTYVCVIHLYQENEGIAGSVDKSGITTLVGFSLRENEREKENNKIHTRTGYILLCLAFYSFVHAVTRRIYYGHNWCWFLFFFLDALSGHSTAFIVVEWKIDWSATLLPLKRPVYLLYYINSFIKALYTCLFPCIRFNYLPRCIENAPAASFTTNIALSNIIFLVTG